VAQNRQKTQNEHARANFGGQKKGKKYIFLSLFLHLKAAKNSAKKEAGTNFRKKKAAARQLFMSSKNPSLCSLACPIFGNLGFVEKKLSS